MVDLPALEVVLVEEMAEGAVADVVQQARQPHRLLHRPGAGDVPMYLAQRRIEVTGPFPGQVHRPQRVLEARVLGGREHPPRRLQLVDASQALEPGVVDQLLLGDARHAAGLGDPQVAIDGVAGEVDAGVLLDHARGVPAKSRISWGGTSHGRILLQHHVVGPVAAVAEHDPERVVATLAGDQGR